MILLHTLQVSRGCCYSDHSFCFGYVGGLRGEYVNGWASEDRQVVEWASGEWVTVQLLFYPKDVVYVSLCTNQAATWAVQ